MDRLQVGRSPGGERCGGGPPRVGATRTTEDAAPSATANSTRCLRCDAVRSRLSSHRRYFNEASLRLDAAHWDLMKQGQPGVPAIAPFLVDLAASHRQEGAAEEDAAPPPLRVGLDPYVHAASFVRELTAAFADAEAEGGTRAAPAAAEVDTLDGRPNLVDAIWADRPALPANPFRVHVSARLVVPRP